MGSAEASAIPERGDVIWTYADIPFFYEWRLLPLLFVPHPHPAVTQLASFMPSLEIKSMGFG